MKTLVEFVQENNLLLAYFFYSLFIMSFHLAKTRNVFFLKVQSETEKFNMALLNQFREKKISPMVYKQSKRNVKREYRAAKMANMIVAPFLAIPLTLTYSIKLMLNQ